MKSNLAKKKKCTCKQRDIFHEGECTSRTKQASRIYCCIILISSYKQVKDMGMQQFPFIINVRGGNNFRR